MTVDQSTPDGVHQPIIPHRKAFGELSSLWRGLIFGVIGSGLLWAIIATLALML